MTVKCPKCKHLDWADAQHHCPTGGYPGQRDDLVCDAALAIEELYDEDTLEEFALRMRRDQDSLREARNVTLVSQAWDVT